MEVLDSIDNLVEYLSCCFLFQPDLVGHDAEELALFGVLADDEHMVVCLDDLVEVYNVGVSYFLHDLNLSLNSDLIIGLLNVIFIDYLNCYLLACWYVSTFFYLAESALA